MTSMDASAPLISRSNGVGRLARFRSRLPERLRPCLHGLAASSWGGRLARGAFWTLAGTLVARVLGLCSSVIAARLLGLEGFGELGIIQGTVGLFGVFAGFGLGLTATKHVAEYRTSDPAKAGRIIALTNLVTAAAAFIVALSLVLLARPLAEHSLGAARLTGLLRIGACLMFLSAINSAQTGALAGFEDFKTIARINLLSGLSAFPLTVAGVWLGGLAGAVWGLTASQGVNCLLNHSALRAVGLRAGVPIKCAGCFAEWPVLWRFSLPAMLSSVLVVPVNWLGLAWLANQPNGYAEMGVFNAANQWRTAILFVPHALAAIALPMLAGLHPVRERVRYQKVFWTNVAVVGGVALTLALGVALSSDFIIRSYGAGFGDGRGTLVLLALGAVVMSVNQVLGVNIISQGKMWQVLGCNSAWAVSMLALAGWLVPAHGAAGLALAILGAYPVQSVCFLVLELKRTRTLVGPDVAPDIGGNPQSPAIAR